MALESIGKYQLIRPLGGGGFGEVFLALDPDIGREIAIKVFKPKDENLIAFATSSSEEGMQKLQERFLAEAKILAGLEHEPYIINIIEFGRLDDGVPWYAMPYLPHSLRDLLGQDVFDKRALEELPEEEQPKSLAFAQALQLLDQILQGMAAAHSKGLVHRDIKPANILLTDNHQVRICDFGIAKAPDGQHSTISHLGMGSRNYMAPEQRESAKHVDARADVYALGVLAYRIFTGRLPQGRFADPILHQPALGAALNQWVLKALSEDADQRYPDATLMLQYFHQARQSADSQSETTATFVGESTAQLKSELRPLQAKISELLRQEGLLSEQSKQQLGVLADIAAISDSELATLIQQTEQELADEIGPFKKWRQGVEKHLANHNGQLPIGIQLTLLEAGQALGKTEAELQPFLSSQPSKNNQTNTSTAKKPLPLKPVAATVLIVLLGVGGWQYSSYSKAQTAQKQQDEQAWQQASRQHSEQSYRLYLTSQPQGHYRQSAEQQLKALQQEQAAQAELAAQQARRQAEQAQSERSRAIQSAQHWLLKHGYALTETGELDARTKAAIEAFEQAEKLLVTGEVDQTLLSKLEEAYWRKDAAAFDTAKKANTEQSYTSYLSNWQDGKHRSEAEQGLTTARAAQQRVAEERARQEAIARQEAEEKARQEAEALKASTLRLIGRMVTIPAGSFTMGCSPDDRECDDIEKPTRRVTVRAFKLMETEVTFAMWDACVAAGGCSHKPDDRGWGRGNRPVIDVSYNDITEQFILWLNKTTGQTFRLPSEAEWEYAARAGGSTKYSWGNSISNSQARYRSSSTVPVKSYSPNAFGLYDMHGNVWEWVQDCWNSNYSGAPTNGSAWQSGDCTQRVLRGGSWYSDPWILRVSNRLWNGTAYRFDGNGFRLAQGE